MNNPYIPTEITQQGEAYKKIVELMQLLPNDQDLGRQVRKLIWEIKETTPSQSK